MKSVVAFSLLLMIQFGCASYKEVVKGKSSLAYKTLNNKNSYITGKVISRKSQEPIEAIISLLSSSKVDLKIETKSNKEGLFTIEIEPGEYYLKAYYIGFDELCSKKIKLEPSSEAVLKMELGETLID